jgi:hypothetical protein
VSSVATVPVWLVEVDSGAAVVELTAEIQQGLAMAGEIPPRVEVFGPDAELTPYHRAALAGGTLAWTAADLPEPRIARAFDGADPQGGPYFAPDHPRVEGAERDRMLGYLAAAEVLLEGFGALDDLLDPAATGAVPVTFRSDGEWIWTESVAYYLERHGLAPEPELWTHLLAVAGPPPALSPLQTHRALEVLTAPDPQDAEPVWQPG